MIIHTTSELETDSDRCWEKQQTQGKLIGSVDKELARKPEWVRSMSKREYGPAAADP